MKFPRPYLAAAAVAVLSIVSYPAYAHSHGEKGLSMAMAEAANEFIGSLDAEQTKKAVFAFDDPNRVHWDFLPVATIGRKGIALTRLSEKQKQLAYDLLEASVSESGNRKLIDIIDLERVLLELTGGATRIPELYHVAIFGTPTDESTWGWRFEGHHISLHFTLVDGKRIAAAPRFLGANPAHVREGDRKGLRVLGEEEDLARELMSSLDDKQRKLAHFQSVAYPEIVTNRATEVSPLKPVGIRAARMYPAQKALLEQLIYTYAATMPPALAKERLMKIQEAGFDKIRFGWAGATEVGEPHYFRIQGPSFLIEHDNVQNNGNHIHSVWRDFDGDFGRDILKEHYMNNPH